MCLFNQFPIDEHMGRFQSCKGQDNTYVIFHMHMKCSIHSKMKLLDQREHAFVILLYAKVPSIGVVPIYTPNSKV